MSWVGEVTSLWGVISKSWEWWRGRRDPARRSAQRLIRAFEAHGLARQQIIRLVPAAIAQAKPELAMADCSSPDLLKPKLTPALLDWAAGYLNLRRDWLDGLEDAVPHFIEDHYKEPARYGEWLHAREAAAPNVHRYLAVWKALGVPVGPGVYGPVCVVYEEVSEGLDGIEWSRYWLLCDHWRMDHAPCVENLAALVHVAQQTGVLVVGKELDTRDLQRLQEGQVLVPELQQRIRGGWYPADLVDPPPQHDSPWRRAVWLGAQGWLPELDIDSESMRCKGQRSQAVRTTASAEQ
ncbi:hypothetical protein F3J24_14435 [Comamonas sp. Tr-654]|uniref:hypothetical protein n=1 Tax=Comamonas sp. Tr-654 TaxID=2608341 RepID=UPI0014221789|nr:hypothetical protein [Comamonas sp. Tr-654]NIF84703.1 hypothetical protein [Comamonas sp. Tr-654]